MAVAILGTHAHADVPRAPILWAFEEGQTRIRLQWNRRGDEVIDHKIEVCAELNAGDCDETDWTVLVADQPQEPSSTRSNMYKHEGLPAGSTRHYRVSSRNDDGFGAPSTVRSATTNSMVLVPECAGAFWSAEVTVARGLVFDKRGYMSPSFGSISDSGFSRRAATYTVTQLYFNQTSRFAEENYGWTPDYHFAITTALPETRLGDFVLYVGEVTLPFGSVTAHSTQTYGESYRWGSAEYEDTFDYVAGDRVTVCLTDAAPIVTLVLTPDSVSENDGSSTVTATVEQASADPFTVTVSTVPPAGTGDFILSTNKVLTFAANATVSTGTVTITAVDNKVHTPVDTPDKTVKVSGELSSGARPTAPVDVTLTIEDDDAAPVLSLKVDPDEIDEDGGKSTITVSTGDTTFAEAQVITLSIASDSTATETDDYTVSSKSLTLGAGAGSVTATVTAVNDSVYEGDKTILIDATSGGSAAGTQQEITIAEDEPEPELSIASVTVDEGEAVAFVVSLEPASGKPVTVSYETADGTAKAGEDYTAVSAATLTFTAGETAKTVSVATAEDTRNEDQEEFTVTLSGQTNATLGTSIATGTIDDDDGEPELRIAGAAVSEGEPVAFVVSLVPASGKPVTVSYETADGTAEAGEDYTAVSATTLTFTAGETAKTVSVATAEDTRNEDQEEFTVTLSAQTNATLGTSIATGTIDDDDGEPGLRIAGAAVSEGEPAQFVVSLVPASGKLVTVSYETSDGTAKAGEDYTAVSAATLTFTAGETAKTVSVATAEDTRNEDQEEFTVTLSEQTNATLGTASATGTIDDDDGEPGLRIAGATVNEGEPVAFVVSLEPASGKPVTVSYETADGTAEAGEDYTAVSETTLTFTAGETAKTVSVATAEDTRNEDQEEFTVTLSEQTNATLGTASATGTIDDDDGEPGLRIAGATVSEGEAVAFVVSLEPASGKPVTVSYETGDGTAKAGEDYTAVSAATLTFTAGETAKTVSVATAEDTRNEDQEEFTVTLSEQTNATLGTASATGTIDDDDGEPGLRIAGATVSEGEPVAFVVSLDRRAGSR